MLSFFRPFCLSHKIGFLGVRGSFFGEQLRSAHDFKFTRYNGRSCRGNTNRHPVRRFLPMPPQSFVHHLDFFSRARIQLLAERRDEPYQRDVAGPLPPCGHNFHHVQQSCRRSEGGPHTICRRVSSYFVRGGLRSAHRCATRDWFNFSLRGGSRRTVCMHSRLSINHFLFILPFSRLTHAVHCRLAT